MPPFVPVVSIDRSQSVRLGRGFGNRVPNEFDMGDLATNDQDGKLFHAFYADLGQGHVRKDLQRHSAVGAIWNLGSAAAGKFSDLFATYGVAASAGTNFGINVSAGVIQSRIFGGQLLVAAQTVTPVAPSPFDRFDLVSCQSNGNVVVYQGGPAQAAPTYEVDSVSITGATAGTITLSFHYNGFLYTTATIAYNATAAAVASAVLAATGGPALPSGSLTGTGGPLSTAAVTLTASGALEGPITGQTVSAVSGLTGATATAFNQTTAGVGAAWPTFNGNDMPVALVFVPATATSSANYVFTNLVSNS